MPHGNNLDYAVCIIYGIDHAVISDTDAPAIMRPDKFTTARRARVVCQRAESRNHALSDTLI